MVVIWQEKYLSDSVSCVIASWRIDIYFGDIVLSTTNILRTTLVDDSCVNGHGLALFQLFSITFAAFRHMMPF